MRKLSAAVFFIGALGMLAPPVFAQAPAPAPAPKVTINGLVDFAITAYRNWSGGNLTTADPTNTVDKGWVSRESGVFTITGEVGRTKGVWAVELDFTNGAGNLGTAGSAFNGGLNGNAFSGTSAVFDMDIDVASVVETKWLYIETPATGEGSFLPWIPFQSMIMVGGQPWRGHDYKTGMMLSGDGAGGTLRTTWTPDIRSTMTYVMIGAQLDPTQAPGGTNDFGVAASLEMDIFKGFTLKPTYTFAHYFGGNCGTSFLGTAPYGGYQPNQCNTVTSVTGGTVPLISGSPLTTNRHSLGLDLRWTVGGFSLQPTIYGQIGTGQSYVGPINPLTGLPSITAPSGGKRDNDIKAWIIDTIAGYRLGPLNMQARMMYTPGQSAPVMVNNGADINAFRAINTGFGYFAGWTDIQTGGIDYITSWLVGSTEGMVLRGSPSYDKYGRIMLAGAVDYSLTPALVFTGLANISWTDKKVNTNSLISSIGLIPCPGTPNPAQFGPCTSDGRGTEQYLGTEGAIGMTYRFAPNVALDVVGSYLWAGDAFSNAGRAGSTIYSGARDAQDAYKVSTRLRFTY
jgi:hypothetical protein